MSVYLFAHATTSARDKVPLVFLKADLGDKCVERSILCSEAPYKPGTVCHSDRHCAEKWYEIDT